MKVIVKSTPGDLLSFILHIKKRNRIFRKASKEMKPQGKMNVLARELHPKQQILIIESVQIENDSTTTYRLVPEKGRKVAFFRAGQYLSISIIINGNQISRPFSISSTPKNAVNNSFYEITTKTKKDGFFTAYIKDNWKAGTIVYASEPMGYFYYEPLRDSKELVCLAGGTGITPFCSIIKDTLENYSNVNVNLFYGVDNPSDLIFEDFFKELKADYSERFKLITVCANLQGNWQGETGFITADLIKKQLTSVSGKSLFICGSGGFHIFMNNELQQFKQPQKYIRRENYTAGENKGSMGESFSIEVTIASKQTTVKSFPEETILSSLERAGLHPPSGCRSGECGLCRSKLISGKIEVEDTNDGRRMADKKFGYFHPCSSFALSDIKIVCPENQVILNKNK